MDKAGPHWVKPLKQLELHMGILLSDFFLLPAPHNFAPVSKLDLLAK
jgi:hypothetical protein